MPQRAEPRIVAVFSGVLSRMAKTAVIKEIHDYVNKDGDRAWRLKNVRAVRQKLGGTSIPLAVHQALKAVAHRKGATLAAVVEEACVRYLKSEETP